MSAILADLSTQISGEFAARDEDGNVSVNLHPGQAEALQSDKRFVCVIAGTQSGKTSFGPMWLADEIRKRGPGDYMVVTPDFQLLDLKLLPELRRYFEETLAIGRYWASPRRHITLHKGGERMLFGHESNTPTNVYFGYADRPESLESATLKGAWLDEAGQSKFTISSFNAILRRLSLAQGRVLITTTPYNLGWLYQRIYQRWEKGDPAISVISFESIMNPTFPIEEWQRAMFDLPKWQFDMFYRGRFTRPAGQIYENFSSDEMTLSARRYRIPSSWPRFVGMDFGAVNTVALFYAARPNTRQLILYKEYQASSRTARQHAEGMSIFVPDMRNVRIVGGSHSEDQWRAEFRAAGWPIHEPPIKDVEVGIQRVYAAHAEKQIYVFDTCEGYLDQKGAYSREVDSMGQPTDKIADKETFHFMDAERYVISWLRHKDRMNAPTSGTVSRGGPMADLPHVRR